jgi:hypothetical protein
VSEKFPVKCGQCLKEPHDGPCSTPQATCGCGCHNPECTNDGVYGQACCPKPSDPAAKATEIADFYKFDLHKGLIFDLARRIAAAIEAERKAAVKEYIGRPWKDIDEIYAQGYRQGLEEAAKEIENWWVEPKEFVHRLSERIRGMR